MTTTFAVEHVSNLRTALNAVAPHMSAPVNMLPMLSAALLESKGGVITLTATDHYTLAVSRVDVGALVNTCDDFEFLISLADVKALLSTFKSTRAVDPTLFVTIEDATMTVTDGSATLALRRQDGSFPNYRLLIKMPTVDPASQHGINGKFLAKFEKAVQDKEPVVLHHGGENKMTVVTVGDHFIGCIMAVRLPEPVALPSWFASAA